MLKFCFGGSFNPIHHAHLVCARAAAEAVGAQTVVLMPAGMAPHKPDKMDNASAADRLEMCRRAVAGMAGFEVDEREIRRPGPSYTIDTVRELKREGWPQVHWLIGADMLNTLPHWKEPLALLQEVQWVIMARPGWTMDWSQLPPPYHALKSRIIQAPQIDISATGIRQRIRAGLPIDYLSPPAVCQYIRERKLYV